MCATLHLYLDWISSAFYFPLSMGNSSFSSSNQVLIFTLVHDFVIHSSSKCLFQLTQWHTLSSTNGHFPCVIPLPSLWKGTRNCHSLLPFFWVVITLRRPLRPLPWQIIFPKRSGRNYQEPFRNSGWIHQEEYYLPHSLAESLKENQK